MILNVWRECESASVVKHVFGDTAVSKLKAKKQEWVNSSYCFFKSPLT